MHIWKVITLTGIPVCMSDDLITERLSTRTSTKHLPPILITYAWEQLLHTKALNIKAHICRSKPCEEEQVLTGHTTLKAASILFWTVLQNRYPLFGQGSEKQVEQYCLQLLGGSDLPMQPLLKTILSSSRLELSMAGGRRNRTLIGNRRAD